MMMIGEKKNVVTKYLGYVSESFEEAFNLAFNLSFHCT